MLGSLIFGGLVVYCLGAGHLKYEDCNLSPNKIIHVEHVVLSADPVLIPGNETVGFIVLILQPIVGMHFKLHLNIQRKFLFGYVNLPCISTIRFGSCEYELCDLLSGISYNNTNHCPKEIASSSPNFPCACPFQPGVYFLNPTTFFINTPSGILRYIFAEGDYRVKATITDTNTNEEVGCFIASISTESDCIDMNCLFG